MDDGVLCMLDLKAGISEEFGGNFLEPCRKILIDESLMIDTTIVRAHALRRRIRERQPG